MSKRRRIDVKLQFPPGVKDITEDISTDDLVRRLKDCALAFQNMSQDDDNSVYIPLAQKLATEYYLEHQSKDVRLLCACCIADVFRVYAPEAPYKDPSQLKVIFEFFIDQLKGLTNPNAPTFKRYFYLLENLAWVKTFNICIELEENQKILFNLFTLIFGIVSDSHSTKVKKFMLDMLTPLISEADTVSRELLDIILMHIIEPNKSQKRHAYVLARDILIRTSTTIEPYVQNFFNSALVLTETKKTGTASRIYDLMYEIYFICPSMLVTVLPQLELKLKSNDEHERIQATEVLARLFSDKRSTLAADNRALWRCFLSRFNDISAEVRVCVVKSALDFFIDHCELEKEISEQLKQRLYDHEEKVRYEVVRVIIAVAKKDFKCVCEELLDCVKERTRDKKFKVRKEALLGLAVLYKEIMSSSDVSLSNREGILWVRNKVLHSYYLTSIEDKLLVERILYTCLISYQSNTEDRMKRLSELVSSVDDHAFKALKELLRCQNMLRIYFKRLIDEINFNADCKSVQSLPKKANYLAKHLQEPSRSQEHISKFCEKLAFDANLKSTMLQILSGNISCSEIEQNLKKILKTLGLPVQTNMYYMTIKQLLERIAPVLFDMEGIRLLVRFTKNAVLGTDSHSSELSVAASPERNLDLLHFLSSLRHEYFAQDDVYNDLAAILQAEDEVPVTFVLKILRNISSNVEVTSPRLAVKLMPLLENFAETGSVIQAKHAVYCLNAIASEKETVFGLLIEKLRKHFTLDSQYFRTALVSIGHISYLCHHLFSAQLKNIVSNVVVRDLLMRDQDLPRGGENDWGPLESLPEETKVKIAGMKLMVLWLMGLKSMVQPAVSTLRLLHTIMINEGDLMERQHTAPQENSWLRLTASTCMLKLCQEPNYVSALTTEQFQHLAFIMHDQCLQVRENFGQKLYKGLFNMKLPLEFLCCFSLCGIEGNKNQKSKVQSYLLLNISRRREFLKEHAMPVKRNMLLYLPENVFPYAIHLLTHAKFFVSWEDMPSLMEVRDCLWFLMEPLLRKGEYNSFTFLKRIIEDIKHSKDKQDACEATTLKLYAVCDLALSLLMNKATNYMTKEYPVEPTLPSKLYVTCSDENSVCKSEENSDSNKEYAENVFERSGITETG